MKIGVASNHRYPARNFRACGGGRAGARMTDLLAQGLGELGHDVSYYVREGADSPPPPGVRFVSRPDLGADVLHAQHVYLGTPSDPSWPPSVRTCHGDRALRYGLAIDDAVFVSRTHAASHGSTRFVHNGVDPSELLFSATKGSYFFFMCDLRWAVEKGLPIAIEVCRRFGAELVVAGSSREERPLPPGPRYVGEVRGTQRAELLAGARALLFPTQLNESFGLVMAEALMSGTPVIASDRGACAELISPDVGAICTEIDDYVAAMSRTFDPQKCRAKAMRDYHYLRMAADYVREYEVTLSSRTARVQCA